MKLGWKAVCLGILIPLVNSTAWEARACPPHPSPTPAPSESASAEAKELFLRGAGLYKKGDYVGALEAFQQSRNLLPNAANTRDAGQCFEKLGQPHEALALYEEALANFSSQLPEAKLESLKADVARLSSIIGRVQIDGGEGSSLLDGEPCSVLPRKTPIYVLPGLHELEIKRKSGKSFTIRFSIKANKDRRIVIPPEPEAPKPKARTGHWYANLALAPALGVSGVDDVILGTGRADFFGGFWGALRGGYRTPNGISVELLTGLLYAGPFLPDVSARVSYRTNKNREAIYEYSQTIRMFAPFMGWGVGYEIRSGSSVVFPVRFSVGLLAAQTTDFPRGMVSSDSGEPSPLTVSDPAGGDRRPARSTPAFLHPEIGVQGTFGVFRIGFSLGLFGWLVRGPALPASRLFPEDVCFRPTDVGCAPALDVPSRGPAYRAAVLVLPQLTLGIDTPTSRPP